MIFLNAFGLMTPASLSVTAVSFETALHCLSLDIMWFRLITGTGGKYAITEPPFSYCIAFANCAFNAASITFGAGLLAAFLHVYIKK